jgi:hypothetical protein
MSAEGNFIADVFVKCTHTGYEMINICSCVMYIRCSICYASEIACTNHPERYVCTPSSVDPSKLGTIKVSIDISRLDRCRKKIVGPSGLYMQIGGCGVEIET